MLLLTASTALAGGRARYGGTLRVAAVARGAPEADALLADTPLEATLAQLTATPPCRLGELSRPSPGVVRLAVHPTVAPAAVLAAVRRVRAASSPYAALLAGVRDVAVSGAGVDFTLDAPGADLERALCHPALAVPLGPFRKAEAQLLANPQHPEGRPYADAAAVQVVDARTADRLLGQRRAHLALGTGAATDAPLLFATYLVAAKARGDLKAAVELAVNREDLTRFFVRAPSGPLPGLLPPALGGATAAPTRPERPTAGQSDVTLLYDASLDDQRAVAERLQVKLQPLGYRVALQGLPRRELRERWRTGRYDLMLAAVLLPPGPAPALAVVLSLAGRADALPALPAGDAAARDKAARDAALALQPQLPVVPLYVQGLGVSAASDVQHLTRDALGLPRLDDVFLAPE